MTDNYAEYEDPGHYSYSPLLSSEDVRDMSNEELRDALDDWSRTSPEDPLYLDAEDNRRLCEQEIERRARQQAQEPCDDSQRLNDLHAQIEGLERALDEDRVEDEEQAQEYLRDLEAEADALMDRLSKKGLEA